MSTGNLPTGCPAIWVGRSNVVPGADVVVPITWDGGSSRYILGNAVAASGVVVDDTKFPLRSGPVVSSDDVDTKSFDEFMDVFHHQMYGNSKDHSSEQIDGEDPIMEVEQIVAKTGKGKKTRYLVKWKGSDDKTWEPVSHLKGATEAIQRYESTKKGKQTGKMVYDYVHKMYITYTPSEDERAVQQLVGTERVKGTTEQWLPGYRAELDAVRTRRLESVEPTDEVIRKAVRMRMRLEQKKDGRKKARLILQGFREPRSWDIGGIDSPVAAMASIRTLLFMAGIIGDVISSIDVSTAFLQSDEFPSDQEARYVYYQPYKGSKRYYYRLKGCLKIYS